MSDDILDVDGLDDAVVKDSLPFLGVGQYIAEVQAMRTGKTFKKKLFLAADVKVLEAVDGSEHKPGDLVSCMIMQDAYDYYLADMKALAGAITGQGREIPDAKAKLSEFTGPKNTAKGKQLKIVVSAKDKINEDTGKPYTRTSFYPVPVAGGATAAATPAAKTGPRGRGKVASNQAASNEIPF